MKRVSFLLLFFVSSTLAFAQVPQAFNYQGVSRDLSGNPIPNQIISLRISILEESPTGPSVYQEIHTTTTSSIGLFSLQIGRGTNQNGVLADVDWAAGRHFLQVETDQSGGIDYQLMGTSELLSVPYALSAGRVGAFQSNGAFSIVSKSNVDFPFESGLPQSNFSVWISDTSTYVSNLPNLDGIDIYHRDPRSFGDVCLKLTSKSAETFDANNELHSSSQVILNAVSTGRDRADFTIQNEYTGPNSVLETFRVTSDGFVGLSNPNPASKLHVTRGDVYIDQIDRGVIMKSQNGQCWRMTVSNEGQPITTAVPCPGGQ